MLSGFLHDTEKWNAKKVKRWWRN